jgi:hypothetical protein
VPRPHVVRPEQVFLLALGGTYLFTWVHYLAGVRLYATLVAAYPTKEYTDLCVGQGRGWVGWNRCRRCPPCRHRHPHRRRRYNIGDNYQTMFMLAGLLGLCYFMKLFEYLGLNKRMR